MKDLFLQPVNENDGDLYYCHWQSVLASFNQIVEEIKDLGLSKDIGILNLDDFADIKEYPQQDFVILRHVTMDSDGKNIYVDFNGLTQTIINFLRLYLMYLVDTPRGKPSEFWIKKV